MSALREDIHIALICQSNVNRSMEAHAMLQKHGYKAYSYGAGSRVRLPGESATTPNIYEFGTHYSYMVNDLTRKNKERYTKNNLIRMLARDAEIKLAPERWQDSVSKNIINFNYSKDLPFHLIFTFEQRVYEIVVQDLSNCILERMNQLDNSHNYLQSQVSTTSSTSPILMNFSRPCHIINIDTTDNHTEALTSAHLTLEIVNKLYTSTDWEDEITKIMDEFETNHQNKALLHTVLFY